MKGTGVRAGLAVASAPPDVLANGGGLSAIPGVVPVTPHTDTIQGLIAAGIEARPLPAEKRPEPRAALAKLSRDALQEGSRQLIDPGTNHVGGVDA